MIDTSFFLGHSVPFKKVCKIYPPTVNEIIDNFKSNIYIKLLTTSQEDIYDEVTNNGEDEQMIFITPLQYIMYMCEQGEEIENLYKEAFEFFIREQVTFLYKQGWIVVGDLEEELKSIQSIEELRVLKEENFFQFQNQIREATGKKPIAPFEMDIDPRVRRIKAKARQRDRIKAKQEGLDLTTILAAICCMKIGITPLNIGEISYASVNILMEMYQHQEKYDIDIRSLLAGADSDKVHPEYWIANFDKK